MAVPEHHHPLDQRLVGRQHLLDPPAAQLAPCPAPAAISGFAVDAGLALGFGRLLLAADLGRALVQPRRCRRSGLRPGIAEETVDGGGVVLRLEGADLGRSCAEARA
jgi:hypothetical protein